MKRTTASSSVLCAVLSLTGNALAADCAGLVDLKIANTKITLAQGVSSGEFETEQAGFQESKFSKLPPFCRVAGTITPAPDSAIGFEVWLPIETWNSRYRQVGNGGYAGTIPYRGLAAGLQGGYATAGTDDGHQDVGIPHIEWALRHPEKVIDWGYRAVHLTNLAAKAVTAAFYGRPAEYSYFVGCSNGGREALMSAQRFPQDFDGWVAGAPASNMTGLMVQLLHVSQVVAALKEPLSDAQLLHISQAVLARCDAKDGVKDGVLAQPLHCDFNPEVLRCNGKSNGTCLSDAQITAVRSLYDGPQDTNGLSALVPGLRASLGAEASPYNWPIWVTGSLPIFGQGSAAQYFSENFLRYILYSDVNFDFRSADLLKTSDDARSRVGATLNALDPDLNAVRAHGKKIIQYHGWSDAAIPPQYSIAYYEATQSYLGRSNQDFYRLFMVPGMGHCEGGEAPNVFNAESHGAPMDARHDMTKALEQWVEKGVAPPDIVATKFEDDDREKAVVRTGLLCPYPQAARWTGNGTGDHAADYVCDTQKPQTTSATHGNNRAVSRWNGCEF